jgi:hypothetical protein
VNTAGSDLMSSKIFFDIPRLLRILNKYKVKEEEGQEKSVRKDAGCRSEAEIPAQWDWMLDVWVWGSGFRFSV